MSQVGLNKQTLTVTIPGTSKQFEFRVPTLMDEIRISARMSALRKAVDPDWDGFTQGLDGNGLYALRSAATFECLLEKSSEDWALTKTPQGVKVDATKFPPESVNDVTLAYQGFLEALSTFRAGGSANGGTPSP